jgi:DNA-binding transcriptional LysR family regulator
MVNWFLRLGCKHGQVRKPFIEFSSFYGMFQLAKAGVGIITNMNNHPRIQKLKLVRVLPDVSGPSVDTYSNFSKALENSKRVRVFVDFLREIYAHDE